MIHGYSDLGTRGLGGQALSAVRRSLAIFEDVVPEDTGGRKVD